MTKKTSALASGVVSTQGGDPIANGGRSPTITTTETSPVVGSARDIASLKLPDTHAAISSTRHLTNIQIRKPLKTDWVMTRPDWTFGSVAVITTIEDRATYVVTPGVAQSLDAVEYDTVMLHGAITSAGTVFFWPSKVTERNDGWTESLKKALSLSEGGWVRIFADMSGGEYQVRTPDGDLPAPLWPNELTLTAALEMATKRVIDSPNHRVLLRLRGQW